MGDSSSMLLNLDQWRELGSALINSAVLSVEEEPITQESQSESFLVGFLIVNIVGLKHYSGTINGREMVGLVREPLNPYDPNAIKVLNMRGIQVGYIERKPASVLSMLIDNGYVSVEGIVPNGFGVKNRFRLPCQIHVFGKIGDFEMVEEAITRGGLLFICNSSPAFSLSEAVVVKEKVQRRSVDEIFVSVGANVDDKRVLMDAPKHVITSELYKHQMEGLAWLVHREESVELPPFWEEKNGVYLNVLTNFQTNVRPEPLKGGIFADDMGLGKTLTLLSLIATSKPCSSLNTTNVNDNVEERLSGWAGKQSTTNGGSRKKRKVMSDAPNVVPKRNSELGGPKTTLVVCPPSVISTWVTQLTEHTTRGSLKLYMYHGDRTSDVEELLKYDIVLTTYSTLSAERECNTPIQKIEWFRLILDEAHLIKNTGSGQSQAIMAIKAKRKWAVTGTPIQNGSFDLFSLMKFLNFEPFSISSYWTSLVQRPLSQGNPNGLSRLQVLMASISLRRIKENNVVALPPKTLETLFVELSFEEREQYDRMEVEAKGAVQNYIRDGSLMRNYSNVLSIILRLRQICNDVALCPSDIRSLITSNNIEDVSNNPELLKKLVSMLQDGDDFDCPICISPPTNTVITCCAHIFCRTCILKAIKGLKACCPLCRHPLSESKLFSAPPEPLDEQSEVPSSAKTSSKVSALLKLLVASREEDPSTKSIVFSQFRKMLLLLEAPLKEAGFEILKLDGSMSAKKRARVIEDFTNQGSGTVLLASLRASGTGINLTAASRLYLFDPWWNPAVEEQAMDRVHRIGQKKDVKIVRLIVRNSIEERILELQDRKKKLAIEAFGKRGAKDCRQMGIEDLRVLMSL